MLKILAAVLLGVATLSGTAAAADAPGVAAPGVAAPGVAAPGVAAPGVATSVDPRVALLKLLPAGSKIEDLRPAPIAGLYEYLQGAEVSYITADGKYFLDGNLYDMGTRANLTEERRTKARLAMLSAVPESQMLIFAPQKTQYTITVFTDVDCGFCRKLHSEMAELNRLGVRVRYLFYPRTGPNTESWYKAEAVWCSANRNEALTRAKAGAAVDTSKICGPTPVAREYALGQTIGVMGTPAIITEGGDYISGYLPPHDLVERIKELQSTKVKG